MHKVTSIASTILVILTVAGCGDLTINQPAKPNIVIEEKKSTPVIIEKTIVEKPVIVEKTTVEKPTIVIEKH